MTSPSMLQGLAHRLHQQHQLSFNRYMHRHYDAKCRCFQSHQRSPLLYYKCFEDVEMALQKDREELIKNYSALNDDYLICVDECKVNAAPPSSSVNLNTPSSDAFNSCRKKCVAQFTLNAEKLYSNFYKTKTKQFQQYGRAQNK